MKSNSRNLSILMLTLLLATAVAFCQTEPSLGPPPKLPGVIGTITAIEGDGLTIKTPQSKTAVVKVSSETRFQRDQKEAHLADFKIGETIVIAGEQDESGTWNARFVATPSETSKGESRDGLSGGEPPNPQDIGKAFIIGRLEKIENMKLTIRRPDGVDQGTEVDENTKFLDANAKVITLADFKTEDHVAGIGALKNGVFVLAELHKAPADPSAPPPPPPLPF